MTDLADEVAAALGLQLVSALAGGMFGAVLVQRPDGTQLVLKVTPDAERETEWAQGASVANLLWSRGYPAPQYEGTGAVAGAVWSLQERLHGVVPKALTARLATQLVALARAHDFDSGLRRPWRDDALVVTRARIADLAAQDLPGAPHALFDAALARTSDVELAETTIVHADFHPLNCLLDDDDGQIVGVFDWEIAGPGDWRFDLVTLASACLLYPTWCEPDAIRIVMDALDQHCPRDVTTFMLSCLAVRALTLEAVHQPDRVQRSCVRMRDRLGPWLES